MVDDARKPIAFEKAALSRNGTLLVESREGISAEIALDAEKVIAGKAIGTQWFTFRSA